jgi:hypothetical protein
MCIIIKSKGAGKKIILRHSTNVILPGGNQRRHRNSVKLKCSEGDTVNSRKVSSARMTPIDALRQTRREIQEKVSFSFPRN